MTLETLLDRFAAMAGRTLGEDLVGVYLHGSAVMGCFNPDKSDVDLLLVVEREITDEAKRAFLEEVLELNGAAPAKGLELSIVRREFCAPFVHPMPFELHFSNAHLDWVRRDMAGYVQNMKGTDPDLAAHVTILNHRGVTLRGLPIAEVFGEVRRGNGIRDGCCGICGRDARGDSSKSVKIRCKSNGFFFTNWMQSVMI